MSEERINLTGLDRLKKDITINPENIKKTLDNQYSSVFDTLLQKGSMKLDDFKNIAQENGLDQDAIDQFSAISQLFDEAESFNEVEGEDYFSTTDLGIYITLNEVWDAIYDKQETGLQVTGLDIETMKELAAALLTPDDEDIKITNNDWFNKFNEILSPIKSLTGTENLEIEDLTMLGMEGIKDLAELYKNKTADLKDLKPANEIFKGKLLDNISTEDGKYILQTSPWDEQTAQDDSILNSIGKIIKGVYGVDFYSKEGMKLYNQIKELNPGFIDEAWDKNHPDKIGWEIQSGAKIILPLPKEETQAKENIPAATRNSTPPQVKTPSTPPQVQTPSTPPPAATGTSTPPPAANTQPEKPNVTLEFNYGELGYGKGDDGKYYTIGSHGQLTEISGRKYGYAHIDSRGATLNEANQLNGFTSGGYQYVHTSDGSYYKILPGSAGREKVTVDEYLSAYSKRK